jgi:hypothetical protein
MSNYDDPDQNKKVYQKMVDIHGCSACGGDHYKLPITELSKSYQENGRVYREAAICPINPTIIFIAVPSLTNSN